MSQHPTDEEVKALSTRVAVLTRELLTVVLKEPEAFIVLNALLSTYLNVAEASQSLHDVPRALTAFMQHPTIAAATRPSSNPSTLH